MYEGSNDKPGSAYMLRGHIKKNDSANNPIDLRLMDLISLVKTFVTDEFIISKIKFLVVLILTFADEIEVWSGITVSISKFTRFIVQ